jgi:hypothetical protein
VCMKMAADIEIRIHKHYFYREMFVKSTNEQIGNHYNYHYNTKMLEVASSYYYGKKHGKKYSIRPEIQSIVKYKYGKDHGTNLYTFYEDGAYVRNVRTYKNGALVKSVKPHVVLR